MNEAGVTGYEANTWQMMVGPARMPDADRCQAQRARSPISWDAGGADSIFISLGMQPQDRHAGSRRSEYIKVEAARWTQIIKGIGMSID